MVNAYGVTGVGATVGMIEIGTSLDPYLLIPYPYSVESSKISGYSSTLRSITR